MAGKQAKVINSRDVKALLAMLHHHRYPARDRVMLLLSVKAGLRAGEIAGLRWSMVLRPDGKVADSIALTDNVAKKCSGRTIPINPQLRAALVDLCRLSTPEPNQFIVVSERQANLRAGSVVTWFANLYRKAGLDGCSSHSGRRTFITKAARLLARVGGSLRDVQQLAGHKSIEVTQRYIDGDTKVQRALVRLI